MANSGSYVQRTGFDDTTKTPAEGILQPVSPENPLPVTTGSHDEAMISCLASIEEKLDLLLDQLSLITGLENN